MTDFGYNTTGASLDNPANNFVWPKSPNTPSSSGILQSITIVAQRLFANPATVDLAVYSDSSGLPNARLTAASNTAAAVGATLAAISIDVSAQNVSIVAGTQYHFCLRVPSYAVGSSDINVAFDTAGTNQGVFVNGTGAFPATYPGGGTNLGNETWTIFGTYTPTGGSQDTPELYGRPFGLIGRRQMHQLLAQFRRRTPAGLLVR